MLGPGATLPDRRLSQKRLGWGIRVLFVARKVAPDVGGRDLDATALAALAMAQHRLGRREQALAALDKAEAIVAKKMADPGSGRPFGRDWDDWLRCRILLDEARKLMSIHPSPLRGEGRVRGPGRGMKKDAWPKNRSRATNRTDSRPRSPETKGGRRVLAAKQRSHRPGRPPRFTPSGCCRFRPRRRRASRAPAWSARRPGRPAPRGRAATVLVQPDLE